MDNKNIESIYPLSPAQQGMLFYLLVARSKDPSQNDAFLEQFCARLHGHMEPGLFEEAWRRVFERHAALRTVFVWERREKPLQVALRQVELPFQHLDWREQRPLGATLDQAIEVFNREDRQRGFDLSKPPLSRLYLIRLGEDQYYFLWSFTHLLLDGWSIGRVIGEALSTYAKLVRGEKPQLAPARPFRDFIAWRENQNLDEAERFWLNNLAGLDGATSLAIDHGAGGRVTDQPARFDKTGLVDRRLGGPTWERIATRVKQLSLTLNTFAQGVFGILLGQQSGTEDVVYGNVVSGRPAEIEGVDEMVGMFMNALPIRVQLDPTQKLVTLLKDLQLQLAHQRQFEYCPLEQIKRWAGIPHDTPLFETVAIFENFPQPDNESDLHLECQLHEVSHYPLVVYLLADMESFSATASFSLERYRPKDIETLLDRYLDLLVRLGDDPNILLGEIRIFSAEQEKAFLDLLSGPPAAAPVATFPELFAATAAARPSQVAIAQINRGDQPGSGLTYAELDAASTRLAHRLRRLGVSPEKLVAISLERSPAAIVALLAVQKAGGATLPIDPQYPADHIRHMVEDSGVRFLITRAGLVDRFPADLTVLSLDSEAEHIARDECEDRFDSGLRPENAAYVIYTSGSTGKSKGVVVEQRNLVHYTCDAAEVYGIGPDDRLLQFATLSFDTSAEEIYPALLRGATLVLRDEEMIASPATFVEALAAQNISVLNLPTAYWHELCSGLGEGSTLGLPENLRLTIIGGEAALAERLERWQKSVGERDIRLLNTYGPTETTIVATRFELTRWRPAEHNGEIPIGRAISGMRAYVLDSQLRLMPPGLPGELGLAGAGVARLYLGRPELTEDRFRPDPYGGQEGQRFYRTGDKVVATEDGLLLFRGRVDQQVKIRGFRVEPGEVESALLSLGGCREVAVVARPDLHGALRLVAYVVADDPAAVPHTFELRKKLAASLPEYMVPGAFMVLASLPKTPSGKIDRRALPEPEPEDGGVYGHHVPPRTPTEELIAEVWQELLGRERIGIHEDFFQLGGHSLLVGRVTTRLRQMLQIDIPLTTIFEFPTIAELASRLEDLRSGITAGGINQIKLPPITRRPRDGSAFPLSYPQEQVWFIQALDPNTIAYNFQTTLRFSGPLRVDVLEDALTEIVRRHEIFYSRFPEHDGRPVMVIEKPWRVELPVTDLRHLPENERPAAADRLLKEQTARPFDVATLPLVRWQLLRLTDENYTLIQVEHHFVHDGWSFALFLRELKAIYEAFLAGQPSPLPELEVQYADYAWWSRQYVAGDVITDLLDFWQKKLEGMPTVLEIPADHPRPLRPSSLGEAEFFMLPDPIYHGLRELSRRQGLTLYMTMLALFYALLSRYTGQRDIGIGAFVANRRQKAQEAIIGMTVNTVVMRCNLEGDPTVAELFKRVRRSALESYAHQEMPFERLVAALQPERQVNRNPLVQVLFSFHDSSTPMLDFGGMEVGYLVRTNRSAKMDMNVIIAPKGEQLVGEKIGAGAPLEAAITWEYNRELFDLETVQRMIRHYLTLLGSAIENPEQRLSELRMLSPEEEAELDRFSRAEVPLSPTDSASVPELLAARITKSGDAIALTCGQENLSYAELGRRVDALAGLLVQRGAGPGKRVGVLLERGLDLPIALLAVLRSGAAYVPLDPAYPEERRRFMAEAAGLELVIRAEGIVDLGAKHLTDPTDPTDLSDSPMHSESLAYVLFTSGSTGRPKGVMVSHRALTGFLAAKQEKLAFGERDVLVSVTTPSFDIFGLELYLPLLHGARVVLADAATTVDGQKLSGLLEQEGATRMQATPATWQLLLESGWPGRQALVALCGGEALPVELARRLTPRVGELWNLYGPTETTIWSAARRVLRGDENPRGEAVVGLGSPLANTTLQVVDPFGHRVPPGVAGELWIGGESVATGYWGRPDLTAERFLPDPFSPRPGARLYRTGDLVRRRGEDLEFLGRLDFQVKVRGFRIELGEIESVLAGHPAVAQNVVVARPTRAGGQRLVAYWVPRASGTKSADLAADLGTFCAASLPDYMVPSLFVELATLPLTPNNKIDRKALPPPPDDEAPRPYEAPEGPAEEALAKIWREVLRVEKVGRQDTFFALGGDSIRVISAITRLRAEELSLEPRDFFLHPSLAALARVTRPLSATESAAAPSSSPDLDEDEFASILDQIS